MFSSWEELEANLINAEINIKAKGSKKAEIMIVASVVNTDDNEECFSGNHGQILDNILCGLGVDKDNIYYTNIVKVKNKNSMNTSKDEMEMYVNILRNEVILLKPKIIVLLGVFTIKKILGNDFNIIENKGKIIEKKDIKFISTLGINDIVQDEKRKIEIWNDLKLLKKEGK